MQPVTKTHLCIVGYLVYDMIHFYLHYGAPEENSYLYTMKRYHNQHHFSHSENGKSSIVTCTYFY